MIDHEPQWELQEVESSFYICLICAVPKKRVYYCYGDNCSLWLCEWHIKYEDPHVLKLHIKGVVR